MAVLVDRKSCVGIFSIQSITKFREILTFGGFVPVSDDDCAVLDPDSMLPYTWKQKTLRRQPGLFIASQPLCRTWARRWGFIQSVTCLPRYEADGTRRPLLNRFDAFSNNVPGNFEQDMSYFDGEYSIKVCKRLVSMGKQRKKVDFFSSYQLFWVNARNRLGSRASSFIGPIRAAKV